VRAVEEEREGGREREEREREEEAFRFENERRRDLFLCIDLTSVGLCLHVSFSVNINDHRI